MAQGGSVHGGSLAAARRLFPAAPQPIVDLSTGINPVPYPVPCLPPAAFTRLPEPGDILALQAAAARAYGVADPAMVVAAPGTQVLISLLPHLFAQAEVAVLGPTYAEHAAAWAQAGATVRQVGALADLAGCPAGVLCNPNNPDGRRYSTEAVLDLAATTDLLVVDEAFADLEAPWLSVAAGLSVAPRLARPGLVALRSFGKSYGLAGIRLGFAIAVPDTAARIRQALGPWAVSGIAAEIGRHAFADPNWLAGAAGRLQDDSGQLDALLRAAGCTVVGGTRLFRLAATDDAAALFEHLGAAGIYVRRFDDARRHLRFGIPAPDAWPRVAAALAGWRLARRDPALQGNRLSHNGASAPSPPVLRGGRGPG